jgi:hypothetical protein
MAHAPIPTGVILKSLFPNCRVSISHLVELVAAEILHCDDLILN